MSHPAQIKVPATYIRGGTSKGVFFRCRICRKPRSNLAPRAMRCSCA